MDTTAVAQSAIAALAGLTGGLGGALIVVRHQQASDRSRQRERAAEVFGAMGPLLTELDPDRIYINLPLVEPEQPDPMTETLQRLNERARIVREQLSMLAAWWPTAEGSVLAQRLEVALLNTVIRDGWLVTDARRNRDTEEALAVARRDHKEARSAANDLRAEIRGQVTSVRSSPRVGCGVLWRGPPRPSR
jgi:hypothetical protein